MPRHDRARSQVSRIQLASTAARLMAQDGLTDFTTAKKKAARQLGLGEHIELPDDSEVEAELRLYQALYQHEEHPGLLRSLRETARDVMQILDCFRPYLTGSVLDGTAGEHAEIDLQIFADSAKEVEIFLLDQGIEFEHATPRNDKAEAVLVVSTDVADVNLIIYPSQVERISFKYRDGRPRERVRLPALETLLRESTAADPSHTNSSD
jgi:hypothetical protein